MKRLLDYDPLSGIETWWERVDGKTNIQYVPTRDVQEEVDACVRMANDPEYSRKGIKEDWWHYAHIPAALMLDWNIRLGIPLGDAREYNTMVNKPEYRLLKATTKWHDVK